jgi:hypothetical protein
VYDRRIVRFTSAVKTESRATDFAGSVSGAALNSLFLTAGQTSPDSLLLGAYWVNSGRLYNPDVYAVGSVIAGNAYDPLLGQTDNTYVTLFDLPPQNLPIINEPNALEFLRKIIRSNNNYVRSIVSTNLTIENASQNVRVVGQQYSLRFLGKIYRGDSILFGT